MTQPNAQTVLRNRAAVAEELRRLLPKIEGLRAVRVLPLGVEAIDRHLPQGGLGCGGLHEIVPEAGATPAAFGFLAALLARIFFPPPERGRSASEARRVGVRRPRNDPSPDRLWRSGPPLSGEGKDWRVQPPGPPPQGRREEDPPRPARLRPARLWPAAWSWAPCAGTAAAPADPGGNRAPQRHPLGDGGSAACARRRRPSPALSISSI